MWSLRHFARPPQSKNSYRPLFLSIPPTLGITLVKGEVSTPLRRKSPSSAALFEIAKLLSFALSGNPLRPLDLSHTHDAALWKGSGGTLHSSGRMI